MVKQSIFRYLNIQEHTQSEASRRGVAKRRRGERLFLHDLAGRSGWKKWRRCGSTRAEDPKVLYQKSTKNHHDVNSFVLDSERLGGDTSVIYEGGRPARRHIGISPASR